MAQSFLWNISVIMAKYIRIIPIQSIIIIGLDLVISKTEFLLLVTIHAIKWNYLTSFQIHGQPKLHFLSAHMSKLIFVCFRSHAFRLYGFEVISRKSSVLIIGGVCDDSASSLIAKYTIDKWESVGNLQNSRGGHRAIANQDRIYVVGGRGTL